MPVPLSNRMPTQQEQKRANLRLGLALAGLAAVFLAGFVIKITWFHG